MYTKPPKTKRALTIRNWWRFRDGVSNSAMLAYLECSEDMVNELELIQEKSKTPEQLQENLTAFITDRIKFNKHVSDNWKPRDPDVYTPSALK